jgi:hypothetical protein
MKKMVSSVCPHCKNAFKEGDKTIPMGLPVPKSEKFEPKPWHRSCVDSFYKNLNAGKKTTFEGRPLDDKKKPEMSDLEKEASAVSQAVGHDVGELSEPEADSQVVQDAYQAFEDLNALDEGDATQPSDSEKK